MQSDEKLYVERHTTYKYIKSNGEAAKALASKYGLSHNSIRSRLARARHQPSIVAALMKALTNETPQIPESVQRQEDVLTISADLFNEWQYDEKRIGVFVSDMHIPYHRMDAYELTLEILDDIRPHAISVQNDELDNTGFGRHDDDSPVYQRIGRSDFAKARQLQHTLHRDLYNTLHGEGYLLGVMGNHDRWIFNHWRSVTPQSAELLIADYMTDLLETDHVLQFSRGVHENAIHLSEGLVWVHGLSAAKNHNTIAKRAFDRYMSEGRAKSVVQGHTHRPIEVLGSTVGYRGVKFVNSGHLRHDEPDWLVHKPVAWGMAIVVCEYNPVEWAHQTTLVHFVENGDRLCAEYKGKQYSVTLDKHLPKHL